MIGQKIGQYRVVERLGTGAMGSVYRASDEMLGRDVALKILETQMDEGTARFRAEAAALARLSHPGIAAVYELVEDDGRLVMAMESVRGQTLHHIIEQSGVFSARRAAELCMQALAALEHAHAAGVVHRDLKPGNLMLTESGAIKIVDFGIARLDGGVNLTNGGVMVGTPAYMAPEQVLGYTIDARADLYAMGVVFFRMVTATLPFKGETPFDMAQSQVNDAPAHARDVRSDLPEWVDDLLTRALAKNPGDRFQSAMEFHEAFARAIGHQPGAAGAVESTEMMARPEFDSARVVTRARPKPRTMWLTAGAAAVLTAAAWLFPFGGSSTSDNLATATSALLSSSSEPPSQARISEPVVRNASLEKTLPKRAEAPSAAPVLAPVSFSNVKLLEVNGARTSTGDVVVQFAGADVIAQPANSKAARVLLSGRGITKATYTHGRDPKWDPSLSGPAQKIDVSGILGRSRHWLVLQGPDRHVILRLDGDDWLDVMKAFEERARIVIDRPAAVKKPN